MGGVRAINKHPVLRYKALVFWLYEIVILIYYFHMGRKWFFQKVRALII